VTLEVGAVSQCVALTLVGCGGGCRAASSRSWGATRSPVRLGPLAQRPTVAGHNTPIVTGATRVAAARAVGKPRVVAKRGAFGRIREAEPGLSSAGSCPRSRWRRAGAELGIGLLWHPCGPGCGSRAAEERGWCRSGHLGRPGGSRWWRGGELARAPCARWIRAPGRGKLKRAACEDHGGDRAAPALQSDEWPARVEPPTKLGDGRPRAPRDSPTQGRRVELASAA
jgi:hypothetical protein